MLKIWRYPTLYSPAATTNYIFIIALTSLYEIKLYTCLQSLTFDYNTVERITKQRYISVLVTIVTNIITQMVNLNTVSVVHDLNIKFYVSWKAHLLQI